MRARDRIHLNGRDDILRQYADRVGVYWLAAILLFEAASIYLRIGYDGFYDEGVYLESGRMMFRGYHLYTTIFDSQPPLWMPFVYGSFRIGGVNFVSAQVAIGIAALMATIVAAIAARQMAGWGAAVLAASAMVFSPMEVWIPRVLPAVPSIALSTAAMAFIIYYARRGGLVSLCLAAALVTCSLLVKLLGLLTLPAVILMAGTRHWNAGNINASEKTWLFFRDSFIILAVAATISLGVAIEFGPTEVWRQAVDLHWIARSAMKADSIGEQINSVAGAVFSDSLPFALGALATLSIYAGAEGLALLAWIFLSAIGLLYHQPLYKHHLLIIIPPIAIAGAVGWNHLPKLVDALRSRWQNAVTVQIAGASILSADVALIVIMLAAGAVRIRTVIANRYPIFHADLETAQLIRQITTPQESILTDAQGIAFLAGRDVPAELTDTSFKRVETGYLTLKDVIASSDRANVRVALLWSARLALIPGMRQWLESRFPYHRSLGANRDLYMLQPQ